MDPQNFVGPSGDGWDVYVGGKLVGHYTDLNAAQSAFNTAKGAGQNQPTGVPSVSPSAGAGPVVGATSGLVDPQAIKALMDLASQNAQQAYLNARLELEKQSAGHQWTYQQEQLAQQAAHDAWEKSASESGLSGYITTPGGGAAQRAQAAWQALAPAQRTMGAATNIWQQIAPGLNPQEAAQMAQFGHDYYAATGQVMPDDIAQQHLTQITGGRVTGQADTLARQQMQNTTSVQLLDLMSRLRGPDDAFAYARTLQNVPPEMRANLQAMMQRSGINYQGPGLGTVVGQITSGQMGGQPALQAQAAGGMAAASETDAAYRARAEQWAAGARAAGVPEQQIGQQLAQDAARRSQTTTAPGAIQMFSAPTAGAAGQGMTATAQNAAQQAYLNAGFGAGAGAQATAPSASAAATPRTALAAGQTMTGQSSFYQPGGPAAGVTGLGQVSPQQWNNTNSYVKRLMLAGLEAGGADKSAELDAYQQQLPKYQGPTSGRMAA